MIENLPTLRVCRLTPTAILPVRGTPGSIGLDLFSDENVILYPKSRRLCLTNIAVAIPPGYYGRVAPRSGLAIKHGIDVLAGVIDSDYRGGIGVVLINTNDETNDPFCVAQGSSIAQLILERADILPVVEVDNLDETQRGAGGFGSTGT